MLIQASLEATEVIILRAGYSPSSVKTQGRWAFPASQGLSQAHTAFVLELEAEVAPWFYPLTLPQCLYR